MNLSFPPPPPVIWALLLAVVLVAAAYDVRFRRIPNWLTVTGVLAGIGMNTFLYQGLPGLVFSLKGLGLAFAIYVVLYALHAMGAGDVKLMAAVGAIVGWENWFGIFIVTAMVGGVMGLILVASRGRVRKTLANVGFIFSEMKSGRAAYLANEELDVRSKKALGLAHGAVIAVGSVFFLALSAHFAQ